MTRQPTSLANTMRVVLAQLSVAIQRQPENEVQTLFQAWRAVVGGGTESDTIERLLMVSKAMDRLSRQIQMTHMDVHMRNGGVKAIEGYRPLLALDNMSKPARSFAQVCNIESALVLGYMDSWVSVDFSVVVPSEEGVSQLISALRELREDVENSSIRIELKGNLLHYINLMLWGLQNLETIDAQNIYELSGSAIVLAKQAELEGEGQAAGDETEASLVKRICKGLLAFSGRVARFVVLNPDKVEKLGHMAGSVLIGDSSPHRPS